MQNCEKAQGILKRNEEESVACASELEMQASERELKRLIEWRIENPLLWEKICKPDSFEIDIPKMRVIFDSLYEKRLLSIIYLMIYSAQYDRGIELLLEMTQTECVNKCDPAELMNMFRNNMDFVEKKWADEIKKQKKD